MSFKETRVTETFTLNSNLHVYIEVVDNILNHR